MLLDPSLLSLVRRKSVKYLGQVWIWSQKVDKEMYPRCIYEVRKKEQNRPNYKILASAAFIHES